MRLSKEQLKGRLKNIANQNNADARMLLRQFMLERFLERLSLSRYKDNFVIKGGMLVTSLIGIALRSTMDIDTTISGFDLTIDETTKVINEIMSIELDDGVRFDIKQVEEIMDDMEYTGVRFNIGAYMDTVYAPIKIDISTGDAITPGAIKHEYKMLLEDDVIELK